MPANESAFANEKFLAANVYAVLPNSGWKSFSVWIMLFHNIGAFTLHTNPLLYMWEKGIRVHHRPWWIRIPSRLPVCDYLFNLPPPLPRHHPPPNLLHFASP